MSKLIRVCLNIELEDDAPHPCEDTWAHIVAHTVTGMSGVGNITIETLPYDSLEDHPDNQALH